MTLFNLGSTWSNGTLHSKLHDHIRYEFSKGKACRLWPSLAMLLGLHVLYPSVPCEENLVVFLWCQGLRVPPKLREHPSSLQLSYRQEGLAFIPLKKFSRFKKWENSQQEFEAKRFAEITGQKQTAGKPCWGQALWLAWCAVFCFWGGLGTWFAPTEAEDLKHQSVILSCVGISNW